LAKDAGRGRKIFALKKWPFLERNWPKIGPKLFKIGLLFCLEEMAIFGKKLAKNCSKLGSFFSFEEMAIFGKKLAQNWPKIVQNWAPFLP